MLLRTHFYFFYFFPNPFTWSPAFSPLHGITLSIDNPCAHLFPPPKKPPVCSEALLLTARQTPQTSRTTAHAAPGAHAGCLLGSSAPARLAEGSASAPPLIIPSLAGGRATAPARAAFPAIVPRAAVAESEGGCGPGSAGLRAWSSLLVLKCPPPKQAA